MQRFLVRVLGALGSLVLVGLGAASCSSPYEQNGPVSSCSGMSGLCVPQGECAPGGGAVSTASTDCYSDNGPTECCLGPTATDGGVSCAQQGGVCVLPTSCAQAMGYVTVSDADCSHSATLACCLPRSACGVPSVLCCGGGGTYPLACDHGTQTCTEGVQQIIATSMCPLD